MSIFFSFAQAHREYYSTPIYQSDYITHKHFSLSHILILEISAGSQDQWTNIVNIEQLYMIINFLIIRQHDWKVPSSSSLVEGVIDSMCQVVSITVYTHMDWTKSKRPTDS